MAQLAVGELLGVPLDVVRSMPVDEFYAWIEFMNQRRKAEKEAMDRSKAKSNGRRRR